MASILRHLDCMIYLHEVEKNVWVAKIPDLEIECSSDDPLPVMDKAEKEACRWAGKKLSKYLRNTPRRK